MSIRPFAMGCSFPDEFQVQVTLLDREIHTVQSTFARCPFLFTVGKWIYINDKSDVLIHAL